MDEKQFQELVEKVGKEAAEKIKSQVAEATKGLITQAQFEEKLKELIPNAKSIMIGEGDKAKSIEDMLRDMGGQITDAVKKIQQGEADKRTMKSLIEGHMGDIEKIFKQKSGSFNLSLKVAANMTTTNVIDENTPPDALIESFSVGQFVEKRHDRRYIFDIADHTTVQEVTQYKTWLEEGDASGAFAVVSEGAVKPLTSMALVRNDSTASKVAGKYVVTEEFTKWRKEAYTIIQRLIRDKMMRDYEDILTTNLVSGAASYLGVALAGTITDPNNYDAIGAVAAQIEALNFQPDVLILNPIDKWALHLSKDNTGQYLSINVPSLDGETRLMSFRVRTSNKLAAGEFILGEGGLWKVEDEAITVRMGYGIDVTVANDIVSAVSSDFDNNRFRVIVETYFHDYIATNHTGSFVKANFATVKGLIELVPEV